MAVPARGPHLGRRSFEAVGVAVAQREVGAERRARGRDGGADPGRRARDEHEPVGEQRGRGVMHQAMRHGRCAA